MARHDREESLEEQLAWLDAIKETEEAPVPVSASAASADEPVASPYPKDPWRLVPQQHETSTPPLFRAAVDSVYGAAAAGEVPERESEAGEWLGTAVKEELTTPARSVEDAFHAPLKPLPRPDDTDAYALPLTPPAPPEKAAERTWPPAGEETAWVTPPDWPRPAEESRAEAVEAPAEVPAPAGEPERRGAEEPAPAAEKSAWADTQPGAELGAERSGAERPDAEEPGDEPSGAERAERAEQAGAERPGGEPAAWEERAETVTEEPGSGPAAAGSAETMSRTDAPHWAESSETMPRSERPQWSEPEEHAQEFRLTWSEEQPDRSRWSGRSADVADLPDRSEEAEERSQWSSERLQWSEQPQERLQWAEQPAEREQPPEERSQRAEQSSERTHQPEHARHAQEAEQRPSWDEQHEWRPAEREIPPATQPRRRPAPNHVFTSPPRPPATGRPTADSLDPESLLRGRRNAPSKGWRRMVYKASGGWIKPGESPEVRRRRELVTRARTPVTAGHHRVAVLSLKGGVGKTTTTVGLGATLAQMRGDRVIAVDANPDRGTLSDKLVLETSATVRDLLNERDQVKRYVDIRAFTSQAPSRLEVLASDRDPAVSEAFSGADYQEVSQVLENFYSICITDCGTGLLHSAMGGVLGLADQIVLVSSPSVDGARAASATLDWLEAHHYADLVKNATVVLCSVRPRSKSAVDIKKLEAHFAARCRAVVRVPYDPHLEEGAEIDLDRLQEPTRDAYLQLAAFVGDAFAGTRG
ncbi:nucleotide-binding protein [Nonomuraea sp. NPDC004297]